MSIANLPTTRRAHRPIDPDVFDIWEDGATPVYRCRCGEMVIADDSSLYADGDGRNYCATTGDRTADAHEMIAEALILLADDLDADDVARDVVLREIDRHWRDAAEHREA